jgi:hypothetical protein
LTTACVELERSAKERDFACGFGVAACELGELNIEARLYADGESIGLFPRSFLLGELKIEARLYVEGGSIAGFPRAFLLRIDSEALDPGAEKGERAEEPGVLIFKSPILRFSTFFGVVVEPSRRGL